MLTQEDYEWAAESLGCEIAAIKAVAEVESKGDGFLNTAEPKILFEARHFSQMTDGIYNRTHPTISSSYWNQALYRGGEAEHERLKLAVSLNREAALKSTSWGKFQIMGFNYRACGYSTLQDFINDMYGGEFGHLKAFVGFIKAMRLQDAMKIKDWPKFARAYNGPGYAINHYDERLQRAYVRIKREEH